MRVLTIDPKFDPNVGATTQASNIMDEFAVGGYDKVVIDTAGCGALIYTLLQEAGVPVEKV